MRPQWQCTDARRAPIQRVPIGQEGSRFIAGEEAVSNWGKEAASRQSRLTLNPYWESCQNNRLHWCRRSFRMHSKAVVRSAALSRTTDRDTPVAPAGTSDGSPFAREQRVRTPNGIGRVSAYSEVPGDWRLRVELDGGGSWVGSAQVVSNDRKNAPRRESHAHRKRGAG